MINNTLEYGNQIDFTGKDYLDPKLSPLKTKSELSNYTEARGNAFEGLEKLVLNDETLGGKPVKYIFLNGKWEVSSLLIDGDDVK